MSSSYRPPLSQRVSFILAGGLVGIVTLAAVVSRRETREDFILRMEAGDFDFRGPGAPNFELPDINGPRIDGPNINGPNIDGPGAGFVEVVFWIIIALLVAGLLVAIVMISLRFGPGSSARKKDDRTERLADSLEGEGHYGHTGEQGWAAFEQFCYQLLQDPEPSRAIRVAMRYAENGFGRLDPRLADETPNEWLRRTRATNSDLHDGLKVMVASYNSVRFGDAEARPAERDAAVDSLRSLVRTACGNEAPQTGSAMAGAL